MELINGAVVERSSRDWKVPSLNPASALCFFGGPGFKPQQQFFIGLLQAPGRTCMYLGVTRSGEVSVSVCLKSILRVTPFDAVELKV